MERTDNEYVGSSYSSSQIVNLGNVTLTSSLQDSVGINVCHFNAASILNKIDQIRCLLDGVAFDIFEVSESWLNPHHSNESILLNGYNCYRNDRKSRGGGILIYVKEFIKTRVVKKIPLYSY